MARKTLNGVLVAVALSAAAHTPPAAAAGLAPSLKYSPAKPVVGDPLVLDARATKCPRKPCRFLWTGQDKGKRAVKLGTAKRIRVALKTATRLTVTLRVTDARKRAKAVRRTIVVGPAPVGRAPVPAPAFSPPQPLEIAPLPIVLAPPAPPAAPVIDAPLEGSVWGSSAITVSGRSADGTTVELFEDGSSRGTTVAGGGAWAFRLAAVADGTHGYTARATAPGTAASESSARRTIRVDTVAPDTTLVSGPSGLSNAAALEYAFSATEAGARFECRLGGAWAACTSPKTYVSPADGGHTFEARAIDAAGNIDPSPATRAVVIDRTAPSVPVVTSPAAGAWLRSVPVTVRGTAEPGALVEVRDGSSSLGVVPAGADGAWSLTVEDAADGSRTYAITARDGAGNVSQAATADFGIDTVAPVTAIDSGPGDATNATTVTFTFSAGEPGVTYRCRLEPAGAWEPCTSPASFAGLPEGGYALSVHGTDRAGNENAADARRAFTVDRTAPAAPTLFSPALQNTSMISLRGTGDAGALVELREGGTLLAAATVDGGGEWEHTLTGVPDGSHTFSAAARDAAGNRSAEVTRTVVVDTTAPTTAISAGPPELTNQDALRFEFEASEPGSTFACRLDYGTEAGEWTVCASPATVAPRGEGHHLFLVRATDPAGNTDPVIARHAFRVDRTPPAAPTITGPALQNTRVVDLSGTTEPFATIDLRDGETAWTIAADSDGRWTRRIDEVGDGSHAYVATARDAAGNVSSAAAHTVVVDTTAPVMTILSGPDGSTEESRATFEFSPSEDGASLECRLDGPGGEGAFAPCTSPHVREGLEAGPHVFLVRATDRAGNAGSATERRFSFSPRLSERVYVAPEGDDTGACTAEAPCATIARAHQYVTEKGVVEIAEGSYGPQRVPKGAKPFTVEGRAEARPALRQLEADADDLTVKGLVLEQLVIRGSRQTYDGVDVDGRFARRLTVEHVEGNDNLFKNGRIGNVTDEKGVIVGGDRFTFDNVEFHDVRVTNQSVHNECMYASGAEGLVVRNSTFHACATHDVFFTNYVGGPEWGNVTLENNVFEHTTMEAPDSWHFYSVVIHPSVAGMRNWVVRYNTFETGVNNEMVPSTGRWVGNIGDWECAPGMTYRYNLGQACAELDSGLFPAASTRLKEAPFGWVSARQSDFRLSSVSPAIDAGDPEDFPARDRDGRPRNVGWAPDAGAYERQETEPLASKPPRTRR